MLPAPPSTRFRHSGSLFPAHRPFSEHYSKSTSFYHHRIGKRVFFLFFRDEAKRPAHIFLVNSSARFKRERDDVDEMKGKRFSFDRRDVSPRKWKQSKYFKIVDELVCFFFSLPFFSLICFYVLSSQRAQWSVGISWNAEWSCDSQLSRWLLREICGWMWMPVFFNNHWGILFFSINRISSLNLVKKKADRWENKSRIYLEQGKHNFHFYTVNALLNYLNLK